MSDEIELRLPKAKKQAMPDMNINFDLGDLLKKQLADLAEKVEQTKVDKQEVYGVVQLEDRRVEVDLSAVIASLSKLEEQAKDKSVTVKNQPTQEIAQLRQSLEGLLQKALQQKPPVVNAPDVTVNAPDTVKAEITNKKPSEAIPVTLTTKDQKKFMEAITSVVTSGGGGFPEIIKVTNPDGTPIAGGSGGGGLTEEQQTILEEIRDNVGSVELASESVNLNTDTLETLVTSTNTKLDTALTRLQAVADNTDSLEVNTDGVETKLDTLHADLDTVETKLQSLIDNTDGLEGKDYATQTTLAEIAGYLDTVEAKLQAIADNTDGLEVNTDSVEAKLDTLHTDLTTLEGYVDGLEGKDYATQTTLALIKAKTDNLDTALSGIKTGTDKIPSNGQATMANSMPIVIASNQTAVSVSNGAYSTFLATVKLTDGTNTQTVKAASTAPVATDTAAVVTISPNTPTLPTSVGAVSTGGATPYKLIAAATTNATSVTSAATTLYAVQVFNTNASARYLKFYNKATAPTVGTDTPVKVITIPGNAAGSGVVIPLGIPGIAFGTGLALAVTTGPTDADTGALSAANEVIVNLDYK